MHSLKTNEIVINLDDEVHRRAFSFACSEGIREIAGPGNEEYYTQLVKWKNYVVTYKDILALREQLERRD